MLKILGKASSINVRKVLWTCAELDLPFEREDWGSGLRPTSEPAFLQLNPNALVPVLRDGDFVLWESNAICRYLCAREERCDLLPAAPRARARVEQWMDWQATELNNSWKYAFMALVRESPQHRNAADLEAGIANWVKHMAILERHLQAGAEYVTGDAFTLADVVLGLSVNRWFMTPMKRPDYPAVAAYYERLSRRAGFLQYGRNGTP
ncbi:glutathione S-transferase [Janthinobacterium sp.]|uniref:glutathione S-transferase family protein n=1 Tax=Janthinobacterium sp. TaxID=1871054 RepID=UPI00293D4F9B|nr:glutathione S-transferase [Janthinobacterium sp.]